MNEPAPRVSFVIITQNRKALLRETLDAIRRGPQTLPSEVIVIDNDSTDGTEKEIRDDFKGVLYKKLDSNLAIGAWNVGFRMARGELTVIMDDDSIPLFDMAQALKEFDKDPRLGLIAANIINATTLQSEFSGAYMEGESRDTHYFIGCGAIARTGLLRRVGFYDDRFFLYYNDNDLAARIIKEGYAVRFYRELKFLHKGSQVYGRSGIRFYFEFRNLLWYLIKNFPFPYVATRIVKELRRQFGYARRSHDTGYYARAVWSTVVNLPYLIRQRRPFTPRQMDFVLGKSD